MGDPTAKQSGHAHNDRVAFAASFTHAETVVYYHTDALGSPVAVTDANGNVTERTRYAPYGETLNRPLHDGPGYTGHETDAATGLVYAQQRYYDPAIGRFLSVDPVTANGTTGSNFNRYWYGNNNPYRFTDPDGRQSVGEQIDAARDSVFAETGGGLRVYGWTLAGVAWKAFGAEGVSQVADKGLGGSSTGDKASAGLEVLAALPPVKILGEAAVLGKEAIAAEKVVAKEAAQGPRYATGQLREQVLNKGRQADGTVTCTYCGKPTATASDHVVPYSKSGTTTIDNLVPACLSCNSSKGAKELGTQWIPPKDRTP